MKSVGYARMFVCRTRRRVHMFVFARCWFEITIVALKFPLHERGRAACCVRTQSSLCLLDFGARSGICCPRTDSG